MNRHIIELQKRVKTLNSAEVKKLNKYLCDLHDRELVFSRSAGEIEDIKLAVEDMVERITSKFVEYGDGQMYEVSQKYLVGSMAEGTRIKEPSEFDFLVVLKNLSVPGALEIILIDNEKDCKNYLTKYDHAFKHAHLQAIDSNLLKTFKDNYLIYDRLIDKDFLKYIFEIDLVQSSIRKIECKTIERNTGTLSFYNYQTKHNGPAFTLQMEWIPKSSVKSEKLSISIDMVLAIDISHHVARNEDTNVPQYFDQLKDDDFCFVLPTSYAYHDHPCFKFTFTLTEVKLMKSLSVHHMACYRLLKYIVFRCGERVSRAFPSYVIKTVLLGHSLECFEIKNFLACVIEIIAKMSITCRHGNSAHMTERTLFLKDNFVTYENFDEQEYQHLIGFLTKIVNDNTIENGKCVNELVSNAGIY